MLNMDIQHLRVPPLEEGILQKLCPRFVATMYHDVHTFNPNSTHVIQERVGKHTGRATLGDEGAH